MLKRSLIFAVCCGILVAAGASAAELVTPSSKDNPNVNIGVSETRRNLYVAGGNVSVNGNTLGDLVAAGGMLTLSGDVEQGLIAAGGSISVNGSVGAHARIAGGNITVNGPVSGDLVIGGGNVNISGKSNINGDLIVGAGNLTVDAPVNGTVRIGGGNVTINNRVEGNVYVMTSQNLTFGPQADVRGTVFHTGTKQAVVEQGARVANIEYKAYQQDRARKDIAGFITALFFIKLIAMLIAAFILAGLFGKYLPVVAESTLARPWSNLGVGLVGVIVVPIVIIILLATIVGYYAAILLGLTFALVMSLTALLGGIVLGYLVLRLFGMPSDRVAPWQAILVGIVLGMLVSLIPFLGWLALCVLFLMVFGAIVRMLPPLDRLRKE